MFPKRLLVLIILLCAGFSFTEPEYLPVPPEAEPLNSLLPKKGAAEEAPLNTNNAPIIYQHSVDFESRTGNVQAKLTNRSNKDTVLLWNAYYAELADYSMDMFNIGFNRLWMNSFIGQRDGGFEESGEGSVFNISLPMKIPAWMKDFGFDKPKLLLQGTMDIRLHGVGTLDDLPGSAENSLVPSPSLSYVPSFTVQGKIGRNITVELNNTEGGLGVRNRVRIVYAEAEPGEFEDYILQRLEAGNTSLSLEGTELTGYAEQHQGLFGIKADWKFGKWRLTTIASQDAGSQETYTINGNNEMTEFQIADKQFSAYKYYFLNHEMRNAYINSKINSNLPPRRNLTGLKVYRRSPPASATANTSVISNTIGIYYPPGSNSPVRIQGIPLEEMRSGMDYVFDANTGILRLISGNQNSLLAVSWSGDGLRHTGSSVRNGEEVLLVQFDATNTSLVGIDKLMLRNVYNVGISSENESDFILRMKDRSRNSVDFLKNLGVADSVKGTILTNDVTIFPKENGEYTGDMHLPCRDINWYRRNGYADSETKARERCLEPLLNADSSVSDIYTKPVRSLNLYQPKYYFESVGKRRRTSISVRDPNSSYSVSGGGCLDIAPNSEKLKAGSEVLVRDVDYQVNYELGQIELISERALDPNKEITVNFECEPLFELQSKLLLGARAEYPLDKLGEGSLFGLTALYKNQNVTSESPRLGGEPFSGLLLGTNIRLRDSSAIMDKIINKVPLINSEEKSRWSFEGEFAASYHNTNTSERKSALIDDFESSSINLQYPLSRILWTKASPPGGIADNQVPLDFRHAGEFVWHSNTTLRNRQIFQAIGNSDVDNREITILSLKLKPNDNLSGKSWGGIMRPNSSFYQDLSQKRYIEMVVRGNVGSLYVDLGAISEDISINGYAPNGIMNTESTSNNSTTPKNDEGLGASAGVGGTLLVWDCRYADCKSMELNSGTVSGGNTDIAKDRFDPNYLDMNDPPPQINGTRGNAGERSYDTEDINRNGQLDVGINFVRYRIDLSTKDRLEFEELQNGWRRFKVPLDQFDTIVSGMGSSLMDILSEATFTRLWYGSLGTGVGEGRAQIADFKIVGNEWLESERNNSFDISTDTLTQAVDGGVSGEIYAPGTVLVPDSNYISVKVVNNRDDAGFYFKSPNTPTERDPDSNEPLKEQSLLLEYGGLHSGQEVSATKFFEMEVKDFTSYNNMKMEIHYETEAKKTPVRFALQFGTGGLDGSDDYYEWSFKPVKVECQDESSVSCHERNWNANAFSLPLVEFSNLKNLKTTDKEKNLGGTREEKIKVVGDPSNSSVNWLRFVIIADEDADLNDLKSKGVFWINDLRLTGINNAWGYAFRTHGQLDFSDVLSVSGELRYQDGDFATLKSDGKSPKPTLSEAATRLDASGAASLNVNKFFKDDWGFHIPFGISYSSTTLRPYLKPEDDLSLSHDNAFDMFGDFTTSRLEIKDSTEEEKLRAAQEAKGFQSFSRTRTLSLGFSKDYKKNDNIVQEIFGQVFLERPAFNYSYRETETRSARAADSSYQYNTVFEYKLGTFERSNVYLFGNKSLPIEFWPGTFDLTLMDLSYSRSENQERNPDTVGTTIDKITNFTTDLRHKADIRWNILPFFSVNYTLDINRDMYGGGDREAFVKDEFFSPEGEGGLFAKNFIFDYDHSDRRVYYRHLGDSINGFYDVIDSVGSREYGKTYGILRNERDRRQDFRTNLSADWIPFLPMRFSFNSGFIQNKSIPDDFDFYDEDMLSKNFWSIQQNNRFEFSPSLRLPQLFSIAGKNPVSNFFEKWKWREIRSTWSVDLQTNGEDFTLAQLYEEQNVNPAQYYLFGLGFGDGYRNRGFWNIVSGDMGLDDRGDFESFAEYRNKNMDSLVYQNRFEHNVMRSLTNSTSLTLPWWDILIKGDLAWNETFRQTRENPLFIDTTTTWPRVGVGIEVPNFANRIEFLKSKFRSISISHRFDYQYQTTIRPYQTAEDEFRTTIDFNPILRINALTQNNIRIENSVRLKFEQLDRHPKEVVDFAEVWKEEYEEYYLAVPFRRTGLIVDRGYAVGDELSISTALKTKRGFQFWRWYVKLDNDIDLRFTAGYSYKKEIEEEYQNSGRDTEEIHKELIGPDGKQYISYMPELEKISREIPARSHEWFVRPSVGYVFNSVASASAYIEYRRLTELLDDGSSHTVQNLAFEIAVMLRFN